MSRSNRFPEKMRPDFLKASNAVLFSIWDLIHAFSPHPQSLYGYIYKKIILDNNTNSNNLEYIQGTVLANKKLLAMISR